MNPFRPKFISFDCYGTLIDFRMGEAAREFFGERLAEPGMRSFVRDFSAYRLDEILGDWKPYAEVIHSALERTSKLHRVPFHAEAARTVYDRVPSWGPHRDVPAALCPPKGLGQSRTRTR